MKTSVWMFETCSSLKHISDVSVCIFRLWGAWWINESWSSWWKKRAFHWSAETDSLLHTSTIGNLQNPSEIVHFTEIRSDLFNSGLGRLLRAFFSILFLRAFLLASVKCSTRSWSLPSDPETDSCSCMYHSTANIQYLYTSLFYFVFWWTRKTYHFVWLFFLALLRFKANRYKSDGIAVL